MSALAITPTVYVALLTAYQSGASDRAASSVAGCTRQTAANAYAGIYASRYQWAPAIRDVISGAVPVPVMPTIWPPPVMPKLDPPKPPPRLSVVREPKLREPVPGLDPGVPAPLPPPPTRDTAPSAIVPTGNDGLDALAEYRVSLTQRARAMASAGEDLDRVVKWLARALVEFAESMSQKGAAVALHDLTSMAQAIGLVASSMDKFGSALERAVAAERKLNPPKPAERVKMTPEQAKAKAAAVAKRWSHAIKQGTDG